VSKSSSSATSPTSEIVPVTIESEMKHSYLDYAMSVIVSRAVPDVRDGLKPVHRRILYTMAEAGFNYDKPHRKSARVCGDVIGKYHPHSPEAVYDALARMAQDFSMRLMLIDGQGNFGSMDGDKPAASRYTEVRLKETAHFILNDYDKETVDFQPNYDNTLEIPMVLPARFPNLLVNGAGGIAVGMATNIPPHNLGEVLDACIALIDKPDMTLEEVMAYIPGPDFPTGGSILGRKGIQDAYQTGRGSVIMRAKTHIEDSRKDRQAIIITEVPYQVNKARLVERIADLVNSKEIEGVSDLRDESDRHGVRVVIELKRDVNPEVLLSRLYVMTPLQTSFGVNMLALHQGRPLQMGILEVLRAFLVFREEVVLRRTRFFLRKAREKAHSILGLLVAVFNIDAVVALIRGSKDTPEARHNLMSRPWSCGDMEGYIDLTLEKGARLTEEGYWLSETQARAILDLRLNRLTGLERHKLMEDYTALMADIQSYLELLNSRPKLLELLKEEFAEVRQKFADPRRTVIEDAYTTTEMEDLIQREEMVVTFSLKGYIKRVPLGAYRSQRRGGRGKAAMTTREEDVLSQVFVVNTHTPLLFFSSGGKAYQLKVYELPLGAPQGRGKPIISLLPSLDKGETISTLLPVPEDATSWEGLHILFATSAGNVRRNALSDFQHIRSNGKIAMKLEESGERLISVQICKEEQDVLLTTRLGRAIRFGVQEIRQFSGRTSTGVRGIRLQKEDVVVSLNMLEAAPFTPEERDLYLKQASRLRRGEDNPLEAGGGEEEDADAGALLTYTAVLSPERFEEMAQREQLILTVSQKGFGKRTSAYAYRKTARGGQGVATLEVNQRTGGVVDVFPVCDADHILLLTDQGQLMRFPVTQVRVASRKTQGVILLRVAGEEKIVSVVRLQEEESSESLDSVDEEEGLET